MRRTYVNYSISFFEVSLSSPTNAIIETATVKSNFALTSIVRFHGSEVRMSSSEKSECSVIRKCTPIYTTQRSKVV